MNPDCGALETTPRSTASLRKLPVVAVAQASLLFFMRHILGLKLNWHFREWAALLQDGTERLLIECARGHGKSYFFALTFPLWLAFRAQKPLSICLASYSQGQSTALVTQIKREIERNPYLRHLMPEVTDTWGKTALFLSNGSSVSSESFGSSVRGGHFDHLIVDDPTKDFGGMSREDQIDFFNAAFLPTVNPHGQVVVCGTPLDKRDLLHYLEQNPAYQTRKYPAITNGRPLWPEQYSLEMLHAKRLEMGSAKFNREYLLELVDPDTAVFKEGWIKTAPYAPKNLDIYIGVDLAVGSADDADYFALVAVGVEGTGEAQTLYVLDALHGHYTLQQQIELICAKNREHRPVKVVIESNAYQAVLANHLSETTGVPVHKIVSNRNKLVRAQRLSTYFENGKVILLERFRDLIDELTYFPRFKHDDLVDALGFAVEEAAAESQPKFKVYI